MYVLEYRSIKRHVNGLFTPTDVQWTLTLTRIKVSWDGAGGATPLTSRRVHRPIGGASSSSRRRHQPPSGEVTED